MVVGVRVPTVLLTDPPFIGAKSPYALSCPNLGLLYLAAALRRDVPDVHVEYLDGRRAIGNHVDRVAALQPLVYGISFASPFARTAFNTINKVRTVAPATLIVCGGPHPTVDPESVFRECKADACCIGEGERTLSEFVHRVLRGKTVASTPGIAFRSADGRIQFGPERSPIASLDSIAHPAWDLVDFNDFPGFRPARATPTAAVIASRGCPFRCTFCSSPVWQRSRPRVRLRSPSDIAAEVETLHRRGVREVYLRSDEMNPTESWCIDVFNALRDLKLPSMVYQCNLTARNVSADVAVALRQAGCWLVNVGIESASARVLKGVRKPATLSDVDRALRSLKSAGIRVRAFLTLYQVWAEGDRLMVETSREVRSTLAYALRQRLAGRIHYMSWALATPHPGSELFRISRSHGLIREHANNSLGITPHEISMSLPGITPTEIAFHRSLGLGIQGLFAASGGGLLRWRQLPSVLCAARHKLGYMFRPW